MSNDYRDNLFNKLKSDQQELFRAEHAASWEHARVDCVMKRLKLAGHRKAVMRIVSEATGVSRLTFRAFSEFFPTFPMFLGADDLGHLPKPLHLLQEAILPAWFRNFRHLPFILPYEAFYDGLGEEAGLKPVGLVFPRRGFQQGLVVHNGPVDKFVPPRTPCFLYAGGEKAMSLVVQPFIGLLDHIYARGRGWKPDDND